MVPHGDRSAVPVEPMLTDQWFADAKKLAERPIKAVEEGKTVFVPKQWENTFFEWMRNIQPWTISRQIWWGHRIPAWYGSDGTIFVEETEEEAFAAAEKHYGRKVELRRDEDVLDTWFSSALWPFSTLGWPEESPELKRYYPTSVLVTGFDIIFFWVARMMMMGCEFMDEVPFRTVYIHALVRDERGQKMSKSKGNVIDPLQLIDKFGADALRFTLAALAVQGRDVKLSESRVEGYRNFATKLWNAVRYAEMAGCTLDPAFDPAKARLTVNRWIIGALADAARRTAEAIEAFRFNEAAGALYQFVWGSFCDWYIEFTKPILAGGDEAAKAETRATTAWALAEIVHLLHPLMPFITEEIWEHLAGPEAGMLVTAPWPQHAGSLGDPAAAAEMEWVVRLVSTVRAVRSEMNVPPGAQLPLLLKGASPDSRARLERHRDLVLRLARLASATPLEGEAPKGAVQAVLDESTLVLPIGDVVDLAKEKARLAKEVQKLDGEIDKIAKKLGNEQFLSKAKPEIVDEQKERQSEVKEARAKLEEALARLAAI
jgi:valyl-tRNA synthetase